MKIKKGFATPGDILKALREEKDMYQEDVAEMLGKTTNYMSLLENNHRKCSFALLCKIAELYEIPSEKLLFLISYKILPKDFLTDHDQVYTQSKPVLHEVLNYLCLPTRM